MRHMIDALIRENLAGEDRDTALAFAAWLRARELTFVRDGGFWAGRIYYMVKNGDDYLCYIAIRDPEEPQNRWTVWSDDVRDAALDAIPEEMRDVALSHVDECGHCGSCGGGRTRVILGKRFDAVCGCTFRLDNPGAAQLPFLKRMVEIQL